DADLCRSVSARPPPAHRGARSLLPRALSGDQQAIPGVRRRHRLPADRRRGAPLPPPLPQRALPAEPRRPSAGVRVVDRRARGLPREAEWEKAARGPDGNKYPWGREEPTPELANFGQARAKAYPTSGEGGTAPVSAFSHSASPYGIEGMAGNVFEWCEDVD